MTNFVRFSIDGAGVGAAPFEWLWLQPKKGSSALLAQSQQTLDPRDRTGATALFRASTVENFEEGLLTVLVFCSFDANFLDNGTSICAADCLIPLI